MNGSETGSADPVDGGTPPVLPQQCAARRVSRAAVVVALAAMTIVAPLTGFAPGDAVAQQGPALRAPADPAAVERDGDRASRAQERADIAAARAAAQRVVMPLASGSYRHTSKYGERTDPVTGARAMHYGTDMSAELNTPIHAVAGGVVDYVGAGKDGRSGMLIVLKHELDGKAVYSWYNHMYPDGVKVEQGQQVEAGDVIGAVGSNGKSTGPHLHIEIHTDADLTTVDPLTWLAQRKAVDVGEL